MSQFTAALLGITPTTGVGNWFLETASGVSCLIKDLTFGGELTTSTAMRTRLARDSAIGTGTRTAGNVQRGDMHNSGSQGTYFSTNYGTLLPTVVAGALWGTSWNAHGGVIRMLSDPIEVFMGYDANTTGGALELRADVGTGTSTYMVTWIEP